MDEEGQQKGGQAWGEENRKGIALFHTIFPSCSQLYDTTCPNIQKYTHMRSYTYAHMHTHFTYKYSSTNHFSL